MKQTVKLFALLAALMLLITVAASCEEKAEKPVFDEVCSERIAAYYGDQGLIVPGSKFVCRAFEKTDFEAICEALTTEDYLNKIKAFYNLVDFKDPSLDADRLAELRTVHEGLVTDENPVYICDPMVHEKEIAVLDLIFAEAFGVEIDTIAPADAAPAA